MQNNLNGFENLVCMEYASEIRLYDKYSNLLPIGSAVWVSGSRDSRISGIVTKQETSSNGSPASPINDISSVVYTAYPDGTGHRNGTGYLHGQEKKATDGHPEPDGTLPYHLALFEAAQPPGIRHNGAADKYAADNSLTVRKRKPHADLPSSQI